MFGSTEKERSFSTERCRTVVHFSALNPGGGGGNSAYESGVDARRKFWIKPLKETDLGVAQAFFDP